MVEYLDFIYIFFEKSAVYLPEYIKINMYIINLEKDKQLLYGPIYSLKMIELKLLKT